MAARVMRAIGAIANRPSVSAGSTSCRSAAAGTAAVAGQERVDQEESGQPRRRRRGEGVEAAERRRRPSRAGSRTRRRAAGPVKKIGSETPAVREHAAEVIDHTSPGGVAASTPSGSATASASSEARQRSARARRAAAMSSSLEHRLPGGQRLAEIAHARGRGRRARTARGRLLSSPRLRADLLDRLAAWRRAPRRTPPGSPGSARVSRNVTTITPTRLGIARQREPASATRSPCALPGQSVLG